MMNVQILVDNPNSWILPYAQELNSKLIVSGYRSQLIHSAENITSSDVLFLLGCEKIVGKNYLAMNKHNIVIHESHLPQGKGWSPLTWQILEGKNEIPLTLFEANAAVDAGDIYMQDYIRFEGHELNFELKNKQGEKTVEMCEKFLQNFSALRGQPQSGEESFYPRRTAKDSELDIKKSIEDQFNLLRVCDNERYPAFFYHKNKKFIVKIYEETNNS